jgi:hypothetical protein
MIDHKKGIIGFRDGERVGSALPQTIKTNSNTTQYSCKKCGHLVWINKDTEDKIWNRYLNTTFEPDYGLCRSCFIELRNRAEL